MSFSYTVVLPRVKCLHWSGLPPTDGYLLRLPVECFASLEGLKAEWSIEDAFPPKPPIFLSPNLKNIEMKPSDSSSRSPSSWGMLQRFEHITRLLLSNIDYERAFDIPSLATALKLCPMLEEVHSTVRGDRPSAGVMVPSKEKHSVPLLHLQSLSLYYYHKIERLLQLLYVPVLTELALQDDRNHDNLPLILPSTSLAGFVEFDEYCLHNIVKLDIVLIDYQYQDFVECIKQLPNLRHLVIAKPTSDSSYGYQQREEDRSHGFKEDLLVRLTPRMVPAEATSSNSSEAQSASDDPPSRPTAMRLECLCPFLERFDFLERRNYVNNGHLTLRTVIPFVSAKWEMSKDHPHLVSKLKHLTLPTRTLPNKNVKKALKEWRVHAGLVLEIAYPYLKASQKSEQYEGMWGEGSDSGY
ncbi:hypothetical protein D9611_002068 [Ephemerocybe angulata]|uniref:Uncharacterized protein n=1 Tax=Ephemerocybe angulata TaxID=980116 RepID=A0A8H5CIU1_9AGAR|nr:hypothetical protein D9611_002068 [Tulosesus angulatus]